LLDTYNYFKRLEVDLSLFFEIEDYDGSIVYKILKLLTKEKVVALEEIEAYESLIERLEELGYEDENEGEIFSVEVLKNGESKNIEYKPSLLYSFNKLKGSIDVTYIVAKAICGFMNSDGGKVIIGVNDNGTVQGINYDYNLFEGDILKKRDRFKLAFDNLVSHFFDYSVHALIHTEIVNNEGKDICVISVDFSSYGPVFLRNRSLNKETNKYDIKKKGILYQRRSFNITINRY